jgi:energy-coupling factor transporter ATP-binding protein EcfA2
MTYELTKFDLKTIKSGSVIFIIGRRNSGKSTLLLDILYTHRTYPDGIFFNGSSNGSSLEESVPPLFIYDDWDPEAAEEFFREKSKEMRERKKLGLGPLPSFFVLEDMSFNKKQLSSDKTINKILRNGRHLGITFIMVMHDALDFPIDFRGQGDYVFAFSDLKIVNQRRLYEHFFGQFQTFKIFQYVFNEFTNDYTCMVNVANTRSNKLEDTVMYYRAEFHPPFRLGSVRYWSINDDNYDPHWMNNQTVADFAKEDRKKIKEKKKPTTSKVIKVPSTISKGIK